MTRSPLLIHRDRACFRLCAIGLLMSTAGCLQPSYPNKPLKRYEPDEGYRFEVLEPGDGNTDDVFVCVTLSGGGTRAAALAYGVLHGLRETEIAPLNPGNPPRHLLDEVDIISSVSGGSFTGAAYTLWRDEVFNGDFERKFLKRDIATTLLGLILNPVNLLRLPFVALDRIDVAATYFDEAIFDRKTYDDLIARNTRPFLVVNATNVAMGARFEFTQGDCDVMGTDLASVPLGWAAAASSAVPVIFSPVRLKYYPHPTGSTVLQDLITSDPDDVRDWRRRAWAKSLVPAEPDGKPHRYELDQPNHRYLFLMDGGVSDNLGMTYVINAYRRGIIRERIESGNIKHLVVIAVDAGNKPPEHVERSPSSPGIFRMGYKAVSAIMNTYSDTLIEATRYLMEEEPKRMRETRERYSEVIRQHCPNAPTPEPPASQQIERYLIVLGDDEMNENDRRRFSAMPTDFFLPKEDVDLLIQLGQDMVQNHPEIQRLRRNLNSSP